MSSSDRDPEEQAEILLGQLRIALSLMEQCVGEMMNMLYNVDLFLTTPTTSGVGGKDPKAALEHVSDLFHVSDSSLSCKNLLSIFRCISRNCWPSGR